MRTIRSARVAVIGGAGFLGSHLVNFLIEDRKCEVLVIDNLVAGRREFIHPQAKFEHHDITLSEGYLHRLFVYYKIQFVLNYAAYPYVPDSFARPLAVFSVNANGAMNVINAAYEAGVEAILQVSSAEIYGGPEDPLDMEMLGKHGKHYANSRTVEPIGMTPGRGQTVKLTEECIVHPHSTYGVAKAAIDYYVQARWREAQVPCIALRQFNCVGERETHPYIVPEIISQLSALENLRHCQPCRGTGWKLDQLEICPICQGKCYDPTFGATVRLGNNSFRDFLYAGDAVKIAVELLERGSFGEVYNLGSETGVKMYDLAKLIGKLMGFAEVKVERDEARVRPWEIWALQADVSKLRAALKQETLPLKGSMTNLVSLEEALRRTIKWYEGNGRKWPWEK